MTNEKCAILLGKRSGVLWWGRLKKRTIGSAASVDFDGMWVLKREEKKGDILGFYHTHLDGLTPSERDIKTMRAWANCFGKRLLCIIENQSDFIIWVFYPNSIPATYKVSPIFGHLVGYYYGGG